MTSSSVSFFPIDETLHHILDQNATTQKDFFENVYDDPMVNGCMIAVYIFGFLGCAELILVLWFERCTQGIFCHIQTTFGSMHII